MIGETYLFDIAFLFFARDEFECVERLSLAVIFFSEIVEKIVIEEFHSATLELTGEYALESACGAYHGDGHFVGYGEFVARIAFDDRLAERAFAQSAVIHIRGVEIGKSFRDEFIRHFADLFVIDQQRVPAYGGKSHKAESQFLCLSHDVFSLLGDY